MGRFLSFKNNTFKRNNSQCYLCVIASADNVSSQNMTFAKYKFVDANNEITIYKLFLLFFIFLPIQVYMLHHPKLNLKIDA